MNYYTNRKKAGYSRPFVALKLKMPTSQYILVERGERSLSGERAEIFNQLIRNKNYRIEEQNLIEQSKEWYKEANVDEEILKFGYTRNSIAKALGCSTTKIWDIVHNNSGRVSMEGVLDLYLFLNDENNRNLVPDKKHSKKAKKVEDPTPAEDLAPTIETASEENEQIVETPNLTVDSAPVVHTWSHIAEGQNVTNDSYEQEGIEFTVRYFKKEIERLENELAKKENEIRILNIRCNAYEMYIANEGK